MLLAEQTTPAVASTDGVYADDRTDDYFLVVIVGFDDIARKFARCCEEHRCMIQLLDMKHY